MTNYNRGYRLRAEFAGIGANGGGGGGPGSPVTGANASAIQGIPITTNSPTDGQVLIYRVAQGKFVFETSSGGGLSNINDGEILSNISGGAATPVGNQLSALLDHDIGSTRGSVIFRGASAWSIRTPGTSGFILTSNGVGSDPTYQAAPSAYNEGTVPTFVQVAFSPNHSSGVTFGVAPTNGNLLIAHCYNPTVNTPGTGWTKQFENSTGTDFGSIYSKVAGAGESTTQNPLNASPAAGGMVVWEINGQNASFFASANGQVEQSGTFNSPVLLPCVANCLALASIGVVTTPTIVGHLNAGIQDVFDNTGERKLFAGHTHLNVTPMAGVMTTFSTTASSKCLTCLITS